MKLHKTLEHKAGFWWGENKWIALNILRGHLLLTAEWKKKIMYTSPSNVP